MTKIDDDNNLDELGQMITFMMNNQAVDDFAGYSSAEMQSILYRPFEEDSLVRVKKDIPDEVLDQIPFLRIIEFIITKIREADGLKLTQAGNLPVKVVFGVYGKYFTEDLAKYSFYKPVKEQDIASIHMARVVLEISKIVKKRHNKLMLTKAGEKIIGNRSLLLGEIIKTYAMRFNMGFFDGHNAPSYGNTGIGFILISLHKYGDKPRDSGFYADKYHQAFPQILDNNGGDYLDADRCFNLRLVKYFFRFFNFAEVTNNPAFDENFIFKKSDIFDQVIHIAPSNAGGGLN